MLQITIDHRHAARRRGKYPFDYRRGETAPANAQQTADPWIGLRDPTHLIGGTIWAVTIDEDHFPGDIGQRRSELADHRRDIGGFVIARHHNRKYRQTVRHRLTVSRFARMSR